MGQVAEVVPVLRVEEGHPVRGGAVSVEPEESLTLDPDAIERAHDALRSAHEDGYRSHWCAEWLEDGVCTICWANAVDILLAAEGLRACPTCNGGGLVAPASCCPDCGGNGVGVAA